MDAMEGFLTRMKSRASEMRSQIHSVTLESKGSNPLAGLGTPTVGILQSQIFKNAYLMAPPEDASAKKQDEPVSDAVRALLL